MIITLFGKPGAGKSTVAAQFIQLNKRKKDKYEKKIAKSKLYKWTMEHIDKWYGRLVYNRKFKKDFYDVIYSTDPTFQDTIEITYDMLGMFKPTPNSCIVCEEAGIGLSSRSYKTLSKESKRFAAMHRHCECDILLISQTVDIDKAYRQRSQLLFMIEKMFLFPEITVLRRIVYQVDVDEQTHDLVDAYSKLKGLPFLIEILFFSGRKVKKMKLPFMRSRIFWRKPWYKYFDSFVDDFEYPMEDPYITYLKRKESEEQQNDLEVQAV